MQASSIVYVSVGKADDGIGSLTGRATGINTCIVSLPTNESYMGCKRIAGSDRRGMLHISSMQSAKKRKEANNAWVCSHYHCLKSHFISV